MQEELNNLITEFNNSLCFECGYARVVYASANNGIFLCANCGEQHKKLGANLSIILDLHSSFNKWNDSYLKIMKISGNKKLSDLLQYYSVPKSTKREILYNSKLIGYHRALIKSELLGTSKPKAPSKSEALLSKDTVTIPSNYNNNSKNDEDIKENNFNLGNNYYNNNNIISKNLDNTNNNFNQNSYSNSNEKSMDMASEKKQEKNVNLFNSVGGFFNKISESDFSKGMKKFGAKTSDFFKIKSNKKEKK